MNEDVEIAGEPWRAVEGECTGADDHELNPMGIQRLDELVEVWRDAAGDGAPPHPAPSRRQHRHPRDAQAARVEENIAVSDKPPLDAHLHDVLHTLLTSAQPSLFWPHTDLRLSSSPRHAADRSASSLIDAPLASIAFEGGSLLDALTLIADVSDTNWQAGFADGRLRLDVGSRNFDRGMTSVVTAPVRAGSGASIATTRER